MTEDSDHEPDPDDFSGICRLFPLRGVVMFPHVVIPLHIFEPRYRQMMEDALATDRMITMVNVEPGAGRTESGEPVLPEMACVGRIIRHERLPNGRYNLLLQGLWRARLTGEIESDKLYRQARAELVEDEEEDEGAAREARRAELIRVFRRQFLKNEEADAELLDHLESAVSLGCLTDLVAHTLGVPASLKQRLLEERRVWIRAELLIRLLSPPSVPSPPPPPSSSPPGGEGSGPGNRPPRRVFPPPPSLN